MVINNIYMFGIRGEGKSATHRAMEFMKQKRFNAKLVHTHTFDLKELPTALKYAKERIDDAIKIVIKPLELIQFSFIIIRRKKMLEIY